MPTYTVQHVPALAHQPDSVAGWIIFENDRPMAWCSQEAFARAAAQALNLQRALLILIGARLRPIHVRSLN